MSQPSWFERKFDFSFPIELLPNLSFRLRGAPARLEHELSGHHPHHVLIAKTPGSWSAQENAGQLLDMEPLWLARLEDYTAGRDQLTAVDWTNRKTHQAGHNAQLLAQTLSGFRAARQTLLKRVELLEKSAITQAIPIRA